MTIKLSIPTSATIAPTVHEQLKYALRSVELTLTGSTIVASDAPQSTVWAEVVPMGTFQREADLKAVTATAQAGINNAFGGQE